MLFSKTVLIRLSENVFVKNVLLLVSGTLISQLISFLCLPILSRLYAPEDFGLFYTLNGLGSLFLIISIFKYEKAIILPSEEVEGNKVVLLSYAILTAFSILLEALFLLLGFLGFSFAPIGNYVYLIPIAVFSYGGISIMILWYQRLEKFKAISIIAVLQVLMVLGISIILGWYGYEKSGLIFGYVFGAFILVFCLGINSFSKLKALFRNTDLLDLREVFYKYIDFPKFYLPYDILSRGIPFLLPFLITMFYSEKGTGYYSMAYKLLIIPVVIVGHSVSNVFLVEAKKQMENDDFKELYKATFKNILILGVFIYVPIYLLGGILFPILLGPEWIGIEPFVKLLAVIFFWEFLTFVFKSNIFILAQQQKLGAIIQATYAIALLSCFFFFQDLEFLSILWMMAGLSTIMGIGVLGVTYKFASAKL